MKGYRSFSVPTVVAGGHRPGLAHRPGSSRPAGAQRGADADRLRRAQVALAADRLRADRLRAAQRHRAAQLKQAQRESRYLSAAARLVRELRAAQRPALRPGSGPPRSGWQWESANWGW